MSVAYRAALWLSHLAADSTKKNIKNALLWTLRRNRFQPVTEPIHKSQKPLSHSQKPQFRLLLLFSMKSGIIFWNKLFLLQLNKPVLKKLGKISRNNFFLTFCFWFVLNGNYLIHRNYHKNMLAILVGLHFWTAL